MDFTNPVILTLAILLGIFVGLSLFLIREMFKKFAIDRDMLLAFGDQAMSIIWKGYENEDGFSRPVMGVLIFTHSEPFAVKLGFRLLVPFFTWIGLGDWADTVDFYGFAQSRKVVRGDGHTEHRIAISTWLGKGACTFLALATSPGVFTHTYYGTEADWVSKGYEINASYPPHFYQKWLSFYA
jgi:hypothetical protein